MILHQSSCRYPGHLKKLTMPIYIAIICIVYIFELTSGFNVDCCSKHHTIIISTNSTQNQTIYFGNSFTMYKELENSSTVRLLIGAPGAKTYDEQQKNLIKSDNMQECHITLDDSGNQTQNGSQQFITGCKSMVAFDDAFNPLEFYSVTSIANDATGWSVSTRRTEDNSKFTDVICRPRHSHRCGDSHKLEGGCLVSGVSESKTAKNRTEDVLSIPKSLDEIYEIQNLNTKWGIKSPCETECDSYTNIDLMFVIDGSASIKDYNFELMLNWIKNVSAGFDISEPVRIGVVQYSHWSPMYDLDEQRLIKTEIELGQYTNKSDFNEAVSNITYQRSSTYTAHAINKTVIYDFNGPMGRYPEAGRVMILLTDGKSTDGKALPASAQFASDEGVISYAVGVGQGFDPVELRLIAGTTRRVFKVEKFSSLDNIVKGLQQSISQSLEGEVTNKTNGLIHCEAGFSSDLTKVSSIWIFCLRNE